MAAAPESPTLHLAGKNIPYRPEAGLQGVCRLDVHVPAGPPGFASLVWFHGGGLTGGERYCPSALADHGFALVPASYRLSPAATAPAYIEDAAAAVAWVFRHIKEYGGAAGRIFVGGASAGAYLALMVGLDRRWLARHGIEANQIAGLVAVSGQVTTHFTVKQERGLSPEQPLVDDLAPIYHVRRDAPPILLVTGDRELELFGRYEENAWFQRMLKAAGHAACELHELPGRDHAAVESAATPFVLRFFAGRLNT